MTCSGVNFTYFTLLIIVIIATILHVYFVCYITIAIWDDIVCVADVERRTTQ